MYRSILCTGMIPDQGRPNACVAFSNPSTVSGTPCDCSCNSIVGGTSACVNCDSYGGIIIKGGSIFNLNTNAKRAELSDGIDEIDEIGEWKYGCKESVEPDVGVIDGHQFAIGDSRGVPIQVTEQFWDLFNNHPNPKYEDIPATLRAYENNTLVEEVDHNDKRNIMPTIIVDELTKRQQLPQACAM